MLQYITETKKKKKKKKKKGNTSFKNWNYLLLQLSSNSVFKSILTITSGFVIETDKAISNVCKIPMHLG